MKRKFIKYTREGVLVPLSLLFVNAAFADATSERLEAYKSNRLIPENITFTTPATGGANDTTVVFTKSSLSWNYGNATAAYHKELSDKFGSLSKEELENWEWLGLDNENFIDLTDCAPNMIYQRKGSYENNLPRNPDIAEFLDYLWKIQTGEITDANITADEAKALKMAGFQQIANNVINTNVKFQFDGSEDFSKVNLGFTNILNSCSGITGDQFASISSINASTISGISFSGSEDLSNVAITGVCNVDNCPGLSIRQLSETKNGGGSLVLSNSMVTGKEDLSGLDLSRINMEKCSNLTVSQVMSASKFPRYLPALTFSGNEDFTSKDGMSANFGSCSGITSEQIMSMATPPSVFPKTTFSGSEDISSWSLGNHDISNVTGITAAQIASSQGTASGLRVSPTQYEELKAYIAGGGTWSAKTTLVYVKNLDGSEIRKRVK